MPATAATGPKMVRVGAYFFYVQQALVPNGCAWGIGIVFGSVPGAASYLVTYWDGYYKQVESSTIYAGQLVPATFPKRAKIWPKEPIAAGSHQLGVTGGTGSGDCGTGVGDPTEGGRFSKGAKAYAVFAAGYRPKPSVSLVVAPVLSGSSVEVGKDVNVKVSVKAGPVALSAVSLGGEGLLVTGSAATLASKPSGFSGFALGAGKTRSFSFRVKAVKDGTATLIANVTGSSKSGAVRDAARAMFRVGLPLAVDWAMPSRLTDAVASSWSTNDGVAPASYVYPKSWKVDLFLTSDKQETCPSGETFRWQVQGGGKTITVPGDGCRVTAEVPALGVYDVTAKEYQDGVATGATVENKDVVVRDFLIVGLGDSNGSGQGNPPFLFNQCDRGIGSYQYRVANYIEENDPRSSVTLLFAACSGSRTDHLWQSLYAGQESNFQTSLLPQLTQIRQRLDAHHPSRPVDAVIMSTGINDLQFGPIMAFCTAQIGCNDEHVTVTTASSGDVTYAKTTDTSAPTLAQATEALLTELPAHYRDVADHLKIIDPAHVFITEYPDPTTAANRQTCTGTQGPFPRFLQSTWAWLHQTGTALDKAVAATSSLQWTPVTGIADRFRGHGYCSTDSYFQTIAGSVTSQAHILQLLNVSGAFHATEHGQTISMDQTLGLVCKALYNGNASCDGIAPPPK